ncbi:MAG: nitroreductase family protein, partial [Mailhella sp.]|nr:nitroreductase family protein [Mailhella sp.]
YRQVPSPLLNGREKALPLLESVVSHMEKHGLAPLFTGQCRAGRDTIFRGAPCIIMVHAPERILSETDCATAIAYLELAAHGMGLASCWAGMFIESCRFGLPEGVSVPEGSKLYGALMLGRSDASYRSYPLREAPLVKWL